MLFEQGLFILIQLNSMVLFPSLPEGGRLQQELEYVENTLGNGAGSTKQILIQTSKTPGLNILNAPSLLTHLEILKSAIDVTVDLNDT